MQSKTASVVVRLMSESDVPQAVQIENECFPDEALPEWEFYAHIQQSNLYALVAEVDDKVVGYMFYARRWNEVYIDSIAVTATARKQGTGEALLRYVLNELLCLGRTQIGLHVKEGNPAQRLYERLGFAAVGKPNCRYDDGAEAIEMRYRPDGKNGGASSTLLDLVGSRRESAAG